MTQKKEQSTQEPYVVPTLPEKESKKRLRRFKVVRHLNADKYEIIDCKPDEGFTFVSKSKGILALELVGSSTTFHSCGYYAFFKPSMEEVVAQVPLHILEDKTIVAFSTRIAPHDHLSEVCNGKLDTHRAITTWYRLSTPAQEQ